MVLDVVSSIYVSLLYVVTKILSAFESKVLYKSNSDTYGILSPFPSGVYVTLEMQKKKRFKMEFSIKRAPLSKWDL